MNLTLKHANKPKLRKKTRIPKVRGSSRAQTFGLDKHVWRDINPPLESVASEE